MHFIIIKIVHFFEYAILLFLVFRVFCKGRRDWWLGWVLAAGFIALSYAARDKFLQSVVAGMTSAVFDWFINSAGILCALGMISRKAEEKCSR